MQRIQVVGGPGSGKTTLANKLVDKYQVGYIELDDLFWKPNWVQSNYKEFINNIQESLEKNPSGFVIDGSYTEMVGSFIQPKLDTLIFLQIPPYITIPRALRRSFNRIQKNELLWGKNKETVFGSLKLAWWTLKSYRKRVKRMHKLYASKKTFEMLIFKSNKEANKWYDSLN